MKRVVSLGETPVCFRGAISAGGRKRPLKHLGALSQEMAGVVVQDRLLLINRDRVPLRLERATVHVWGRRLAG